MVMTWQLSIYICATEYPAAAVQLDSEFLTKRRTARTEFRAQRPLKH
jgi:hypothetical protein